MVVSDTFTRDFGSKQETITLAGSGTCNSLYIITFANPSYL